MRAGDLRCLEKRVSAHDVRSSEFRGRVVGEIEDVLERAEVGQVAAIRRIECRVVAVENGRGGQQVPGNWHEVRALDPDLVEPSIAEHRRPDERLVDERERVRVGHVLAAEGNLELTGAQADPERLWRQGEVALFDAEGLTVREREDHIRAQVGVDVGEDLHFDLLGNHAALRVARRRMVLAAERAEEETVHRHRRVEYVGEEAARLALLGRCRSRSLGRGRCALLRRRGGFDLLEHLLVVGRGRRAPVSDAAVRRLRQRGGSEGRERGSGRQSGEHGPVHNSLEETDHG